MRAAGSVRLVPVFPLPETVLFPHTVLPLHVFEPRYRAMVRDASSGSRLICISLLRPGYENDYEGNPAFHPTATIGRIEDLIPLEDGRFTLNLSGLERVELEETASDRGYRMALATPRPERPPGVSEPILREAQIELLASHGYLSRELSGGSGVGLAVREELPFAVALNGVCANLPVDAALRQSLLECDELWTRHRDAMRLVNALLDKVLELRTGALPDRAGGSGRTLN